MGQTVSAGRWRQVAERAVRTVLSDEPVGSRLIETGNSNHVVHVTLESGDGVAVRISKVGASRFEMERSVIEIVRSAGVPAPEVRHVGAVAEDDPEMVVMISAWVDAPPLADLSADHTARPETSTALAELLAQIHSVAVDGFGNLGPDLRGVADDFAVWFVDGAVDRIAASARVIAETAPESARLPDRAAEALQQHRDAFGRPRSLLAHGDISPNNILVDATGAIAAVLDWEAAKGGPPSLDLGWLAFIDPSRTIDHQAVRRTYAGLTGQDLETIEFCSGLVELRILATMAEWQARAGLENELPTTLRRLETALASHS